MRSERYRCRNRHRASGEESAPATGCDVACTRPICWKSVILGPRPLEATTERLGWGGEIASLEMHGCEISYSGDRVYSQPPCEPRAPARGTGVWVNRCTGLYNGWSSFSRSTARVIRIGKGPSSGTLHTFERHLQQVALFLWLRASGLFHAVIRFTIVPH